MTYVSKRTWGERWRNGASNSSSAIPSSELSSLDYKWSFKEYNIERIKLSLDFSIVIWLNMKRIIYIKKR
jgi:hypothetical protein